MQLSQDILLFQWYDFIEHYHCPSMNFNHIIQTNLENDEKLKVAAMNTIINNNMIEKLKFYLFIIWK